jgi:hypothetical protein
VIADGPVFWPYTDLDGELDTMVGSGVESIRVAFYWRVAQPYAPHTKVPRKDRDKFFDFDGIPTNFEAADRIVAAAAKRHLTVLPVILGAPGWAALRPSDVASPPRGTRRYARFLRAVALRYGPKGAFWAAHPELPARPIRRWQIWNEPNITAYWSTQPFVRAYVALLRAANRSLKAVDPDAQIVLAGMPNTSWRALEEIYRAGGRRWFDIGAVHPYTYYVRNVIKLVRLNRIVMARHGDARKPLIVSEITWSSGRSHVRDDGSFRTLTERGQAARLGEGLRALAGVRRRYRIAQVYWYTWLSPPIGDSRNAFDYAGLRRLASRGGKRPVAKPALSAFRDAAVALEGCAKAAVATSCR